MAITATFQADFTKWNAALKTRSLPSSRWKCLRRVCRRNSRDGDLAVWGQHPEAGELAVAAVNSIGGVTKLTSGAGETQRDGHGSDCQVCRAGPEGAGRHAEDSEGNQAGRVGAGGIGGALGPLAGLFAGAFTVGAISNAVGETIKFAGSLNDLSAKTGISVEALQEFKFAGSQSV
jgi:hypothetical protein